MHLISFHFLEVELMWFSYKNLSKDWIHESSTRNIYNIKYKLGCDFVLKYLFCV